MLAAKESRQKVVENPGLLRKSLHQLKHLYIQRVRGFDPPGDEPWMDEADAERFKAELARARSYVEFGSGGTTVLADKLGKPTISVESDRFYARAVASRLSPNSRVRQITVDVGLTTEWGTPVFSTRNKAARYVTAPFGAGPFPDFILVDGRYRVACVLESARRACLARSKATLMLDDYLDRPHYHRIEAALGVPEIVGRAAILQIGSRPLPWSTVDAALVDKR